jgi:phage tail protein X
MLKASPVQTAVSASGSHPGRDRRGRSSAQLAIGFNGEIVARIRSAPQRVLLPDLSATKTLVAMSLLPHLADGSIDLTAPWRATCRHGDNGKDMVTVLQLLTMQGGSRKSYQPDRGERALDDGNSFPNGISIGLPDPARVPPHRCAG